MKVTKSSIYPGSRNLFIALMNRFIILHEGRWIIDSQSYMINKSSTDDKNLLIYDIEEDVPLNEKRVPERLPRVACIFVTEKLPNQTTVEFIDGKSSADLRYGLSTERPVGDGFQGLIDAIISEWENPANLLLKQEEVKTTNRIDAVKYAGSVAHFRAWMDRFLAVNGSNWMSEDSKGRKDSIAVAYYQRAYTSTREVWNVTPVVPIHEGKRKGDNRHAVILAVEEKTDLTIVEFLDARKFAEFGSNLYSLSYEKPYPVTQLISVAPVGEVFKFIVNKIKEELAETTKGHDINPEEPKTSNLTEWFIYFHQVRHQKRISLRDIAKKTGYSYDYVREKHGHFRKERENDNTT